MPVTIESVKNVGLSLNWRREAQMAANARILIIVNLAIAMADGVVRNK